MGRLTKRILLLAAIAVLSIPAAAEVRENPPEHPHARTPQPVSTQYVTRATLYGAGFTNVFDTYLSPQEYKGVDFRISRETMRMTRLGGGNVSAQNFLQADVGYTHNRAENNNTLSALANWSYGLHYQLRLTPRFKLLLGGLFDANGGFVYNLRNGNNPASARAAIDLCASGMAVWQFRLRRTPLTLRYHVNLPLAGMMFSPHYGQSYYEIFSLGNAGGTVRFTSLHNHPSLRQMLSVDVPVGRTTMRLAYLCDLQQAKVNGLKTHAYSHVFMAGFVKTFSLMKRKTNPNR